MMTTSRTLLSIAGAVLSAACSHATQSTKPTPTDSVEVGYGAQRKDKVAGAVTSLGRDDFTSRPMAVEALLRGKVPGLEIIPVGNGVTFRIRGAGSMLVDQEPLVIVDGQMIQAGNIAGALAGLAPDDIKRVDVLKDVASTSIYGQRGAGGVIVITTKVKSPPA